ncbi:ribosome biogenesis GTP-binding protein YihA/YsxC [Mycoplasma procyoni]|uniref:ribosome biogenesis GTP-binding protein YihA/YsxC n=1 Tax=Mycoplasma procyoni TaxID=568784 RepID=UPI00197CA63E|nr:ribosome biogenesis GTP-binding protein YihA/YsxC [Mycoplasma procyoni]MBN3534572.1 YihA family ribosome biogenesis GTP-binding protein [Mycoplasma procyoni]
MWKFIVSSSKKDNWYDHNGFEICFIGRSNVGKSSLINALANTKIAKTSNTPGRTQLINFFSDDQNRVVVDLPGYGYAKMSKSAAEKMFEMIEQYFAQRLQLKTVFLLFDSRLGLQEIDKQMIEFLNSVNRKIVLVGTKMDKLNQSQQHAIKKQMEQYNNFKNIIVSSQTKRNIANLQQIINEEFNN